MGALLSVVDAKVAVSLFVYNDKFSLPESTTTNEKPRSVRIELAPILSCLLWFPSLSQLGKQTFGSKQATAPKIGQHCQVSREANRNHSGRLRQ